MDITYQKLYTYDHVRQLLATDGSNCFCGDNGPMNKNPVKVHKGLDNDVIFRVLGPDRVPYAIGCDEEVYGRIIDTDNQTIIFEKLCRLGPAKGIIHFELDSGDIVDIPAATYKLVILRISNFAKGYPGYNIAKPLFSDLYDNVSMELEITDQAIANPVPSIVYEPKHWTPDRFQPPTGFPINSFYTGRIPGSRVLNHKESIHTFSTFTECFTGVLQVWGTLDETPDAYLDNSRWFPIFPSSTGVDIQYINYTGTQYWSFTGNYMWLKFRYIPSTDVLNPGIFRKLIVRP